MKQFFFISISLVFFSSISFGQKWDPEVICSDDTLVITPRTSMKFEPKELDSLERLPYKIIECHTRSKIGFRFEVAISNYFYGDKTNSWLGQEGGANFNFILVYNKLNLGFRFKPMTVNPKTELDFNGQTLPKSAKLNNIRIDYFLGYSFDFKWLFSIEPYLGYNSTTFLVINEDEIKQEFSFNKTGGLILGATLNKYFSLKNYGYVALFSSAGYSFVDYERVHPDLDNGYFEWSIHLELQVRL
jgi:hypothetical protein